MMYRFILLFSFALLLASCGNEREDNDRINALNELSKRIQENANKETKKVKSDLIIENIVDLNVLNYISNPCKFYSERLGGNTIYKHEKIGEIKITSEQLIASGLVTSHSTRPYLQKVPNGNHHVYRSFITNNLAGERNSYISVEFSKNKTNKWVLCTTKSSNKPYSNGDYTGFGVDSGTCLFADYSASNTLKSLSSSKLFSDVNKYLSKNEWHKALYFKNEVFLFTSGFGDGVYPAYIGYDRENVPTKFIIDFMIIDKEIVK